MNNSMLDMVLQDRSHEMLPMKYDDWLYWEKCQDNQNDDEDDRYY